MHFHRDMLAICDTFGKYVLRAQPNDRFIGSPPIAFTFGLGGLVLFPLRVGAAAILLEKAAPDDLLPAIEQFGATICFTAPTAYRNMLGKLAEHRLSSLRKCVSAGETLAGSDIRGLAGSDRHPHHRRPRFDRDAAYLRRHPARRTCVPGATGKPVPGYEARVIDEAGREVPAGTPGRLAVRGPTGCRYLGDKRQAEYVQHGWNITGDTYIKDADGYFQLSGALRRHDHFRRATTLPGRKSKRCC